LVPELRIESQKHDLSEVSFLAVGAAGSLVVGQPQDYGVHLFSASGADNGAIGRKGSGPGEFRSPELAGFVGDSLWIHDHELRRTTVFSANRSTVRTFEMISAPVPAAESARFSSVSVARPLALYGDGTVLVQGHPVSREIVRRDGFGGQAGDWLVRVNLGDAAQAVTRTVVARLPIDSAAYTRYVGESSSVGAFIPFYPSAQFSVAPDGGRIVVVTMTPSTDRAFAVRLTIVSANGDTIARSTLSLPGDQIPKRVMDSVLAFRSGRAPVDARVIWETIIRDRMPKAYPPISAVRCGRDDTVWLRLTATPEGRPWLVLDGNGKTIAQVMLPPRYTLVQADRVNVWAITTDDDGFATIVRFRVQGASTPNN
jgi:hypothetical protein